MAFALGIGGIQELVSLIVVRPIVMEAGEDLIEGRETGFGAAFRRLGQDLRRLLLAC